MRTDDAALFAALRLVEQHARMKDQPAIWRLAANLTAGERAALACGLATATSIMQSPLLDVEAACG